MSDYHIGKTRLEQLDCCKCRQKIPKGSNCLFTRWSWLKYCLNCGKEIMMERVDRIKAEIKYSRRLVKQLSKDKLIKENLCASLKL